MVATLGRFSVSLEIWRSDLTSDLTSRMGGPSRIMYVSMYDMYDICDAYDVDNVHDVYEMLMLKIRKCQACPRAVAHSNLTKTIVTLRQSNMVAAKSPI